MPSLAAHAYPTPGTDYAVGPSAAPTPGTFYTSTFTDNYQNPVAISVLNLSGVVTSLVSGAGSLASLSLAGLTTAAEIMFVLPVSATGYSGNAVLVYCLSTSGAGTSNPVTIASTGTPGMVWTLGSCSINGQVCALNQTDGLFYPTQAVTIGGVVTATIAAAGFSFP